MARPTRPLHFLGRVMLFGTFITSIALCMLVYVPWSREPFDILDFSEFLLQLQADGNFWNSWARLAKYYASQGRVNEVPYGLIAANYHVFGLDPLGWQVVRSVQMLVLPPTAYLVLRRYGASRFGSTLGASLFLVGSVPASSWLRQTAEPLGTLLFLAAAALTCGFSESGAPGRRALAIGACATGMLLSKETLVACLPFLVLTASCWQENGQLRTFRFDRRTAQIAGVCAVAAAVLLGALMWAQTMRQPDAYATLYGSARLADNLWAARVLPLILPVSFPSRPRELILFPPNLVFVGMLCAGFVASWRWANRDQIHRKLLIALTLLLAGLLVYLPWPRFELFYGLPFLVGLGLCVAILLGELGRDSPWKVGLTVCWVLVLVGSALTSVGQARYIRAQREVNQALALDLSKHDPTDTVIVASAGMTSQAWQNPAVTLARYTIATRAARNTPVVRDVSCDAISAIAGQPRRRSTLYVYVGWCGESRPPDRRIERPFSYFDWHTLSMKPATFMVDVFEWP